MHELSITRNVVSIVSERAQGQKVLRVTLEVGRLSGMFSEAIRFCFDICAKGTPLEGARLVIDEPPGRLHCRTCQVDQGTDDLILLCTCGSADVEVTAGRELALLSVEVV